jgi:hypothetical protein
VRATTARHLQRPKSLKMKETGNRVFRLRLIFGQDAQQISISLGLEAALCGTIVRRRDTGIPVGGC